LFVTVREKLSLNTSWLAVRRTAVDIRAAIELNIGDSGWQLDYFCLQLAHDTRSRGKTRDFSPIELQAGLSDRR
jgi:hypothetical protein